VSISHHYQRLCVNNTGNTQDTQLRILQSVAAHVKLLLDTPEHIWRLLEKKKYLHAGWLFLLARIIYQALVRDDTEDESDWTPYGIDIQVRTYVWITIVSVRDLSQEQFPLVQRQWDAVAPLRAQITYKATLSLRDSNTSLEARPSRLSVLDFLVNSSPGHLLDSSNITSPRISTIDGCIVRLPCTAGKKLSGDLIAKPKVCTQWVLPEW
jgi:hypothetical protein